MALFEKFDGNAMGGRDFGVGDLHGCYATLMALLTYVDFDKTKDRLFSVGDLVDRGPRPLECLALHSEPWFFGIRGNHEHVYVHYRELLDEENCIRNGGRWFLDLPEETKEMVSDLCHILPFAVELDTPHMGRIGFVHAQAGKDWKELETKLKGAALLSKSGSKQLAHEVLYSRRRIRDKDDSPVANIDWVFCGHTRLMKPAQLGNTIYIDTAVDHRQGHEGPIIKPILTMVELTDTQFKFYHMERVDIMPSLVEEPDE